MAAGHRSRAPRTLGFVSSLVRGANLLSNARVWRRVCAGVDAFTDARLEVIRRRPTADELAYIPANRRLLEACVLQVAERAARPALQLVIDALVALIGAGPWTADSKLRYHCTDTEMLLDDVHLLAVRAAMVTEIAAKIRALFFRAQPGTPAAGRWTGVAFSACWHAGVTAFFGLLTWLLSEVLKWRGRVTPAENIENLDGPNAGDPDLQRKFLGARRSLYVRFLEESCPPATVGLGVHQRPVRRMLHFLFTHSYETQGSIAPQDQALAAVVTE